MMGAPFNDLTGVTFGELTVISRAENDGKGTRWNCDCSCGKKRVVRHYALTCQQTKSCGHLRAIGWRAAREKRTLPRRVSKPAGIMRLGGSIIEREWDD